MIMRDVSKALSTCPFEAQAYRVSEYAGPESAVITAVRLWPEPQTRSFSLTKVAKWRPVSLSIPGQVLGLADGTEDHWSLGGWSPDIRPFIGQIPHGVRQALRSFPLIYAGKVLRVLAAVPGALDLAREHAVLMGLLAWDERTLFSDSPFYQHTVRQDFLDAVDGPRRRLLPLLGLPDAQWIIRVMEKMDPHVLAQVGDEGLIELLGTTDKRIERRLQHVPDLSVDVVEVIIDPTLRRMCTFGLLADPATDLVDKLARLDRFGRTRRYRSRAEVHAAHACLPADVRRLGRGHWNPADYPGEFSVPTGEVVLDDRPPTITLRPVRNAEEMRSHGLIQESCIPSDDRYPRRASRGVGAMYTALWRRDKLVATVWLRQKDGSGWVIAETAGPRNVRVPPGITDRLEEWVASLVSRSRTGRC